MHNDQMPRNVTLKSLIKLSVNLWQSIIAFCNEIYRIIFYTEKIALRYIHLVFTVIILRQHSRLFGKVSLTFYRKIKEAAKVIFGRPLNHIRTLERSWYKRASEFLH